MQKTQKKIKKKTYGEKHDSGVESSPSICKKGSPSLFSVQYGEITLGPQEKEDERFKYCVKKGL